MSPKPPENGMEGDDEREEESEEENSEEEEEDEPRLKYQRMAAAFPRSSKATPLHVKEFIAHTAAVNDLCFDIEGEYIASCSDDGSVVISSLFTDERMKFEYHRPMKTIALDPDYVRKSSRRFVTGGLAGHLYFNVKKWIGYRDQVLHSGEGPIHSVKWRASLIAWANDAGVKVYDAANDQRVTFIERPRGSPRPELLLPHLVWQDDTVLVIGWGTSVKIVSIRSNQNKGANGTYKNIQMSSMNQVDIVASFQTTYFISGIAPFGDSLVVLAYIPVEDGEKDFSSTIPSRQGNAQRPEVRVVTWNNDELATDALPIHGFEHYKAKDYSLAHAPFSGSSYAGGQWAAGDEPLYYIVSPKDVVIAKPRDTEDHIAWLLQHGYHEKALAAVEAGQGERADE
ncbi:UNVERIFIED_CONTAM: Vacuolar protein sorting-associated protein 41 [Sesamum latifolium]|uniref:Vacuolar protein sorting-associated protein 41 n=1 Tax=Sesamum latifolium TaxID=2727402 RepID=A0AAW2Y499_9LAMI